MRRRQPGFVYRIRLVLLVVFASCGLGWTQEPAATDSEFARKYYLEDLTRLPDYRAGKNSFLLQRLHRGDRRVLLEVTGSGSVRHIWSTWSIPGDNSDIPAPGRVLVRIYLNGEAQPAIAGAWDELCRAAEETESRFVPLPAFNYKGAFNFYLPIFFADGIRIEMEAVDEIEEFYTQIDYRIGTSREKPARLVSEKSGDRLRLSYPREAGGLSWETLAAPRVTRESKELDYGPEGKAGEFVLQGPRVLRELRFRGTALDDVELSVYWDDDTTPSVQAPLRYLFADFRNVALDSRAGERACYFLMPFRKKARIAVRGLRGASGRIGIEYAIAREPIPPLTLYFHAQFREAARTVGYLPYPVLQVRGEGLFVGMNLFDSGHNHGGGDSALIDGGTEEPRVLHGICGEDYFGFAWHKTGNMTLLTGAPAHERRYRLHLENPYPFHDSLQLSFGVFAGQHPKSVAFWYQLPWKTADGRQPHEAGTPWMAVNASWKILGPAAVETELPGRISGDEYATSALIKEPTKLNERWQDAEMQWGFFDATYQFRHYAMIESGTGFVAGAGKMRMKTYVYSATERSVDAILGHDDQILVHLNDAHVGELAPGQAFGPSRIGLRLHAGWNTLDLVVYNDENVNWRWWGVSLALDTKASRGLRFASELPTGTKLQSDSFLPTTKSH